MKIADEAVATLSYELTDEEGRRLDDGEPIVYIHGRKQILPALEEAVAGAAVDERLEVTLPPERAYGERMENLVFEAPLQNLPPEIRDNVVEGGVLHTAHEERRFSLRVVELRETTALVDGNHPLAGHTLHFRVHVADVRPAEADELSTGRVRQPTIPN